MANGCSSQPQHLASTPIDSQSIHQHQTTLLSNMFGALNRFISRLDAASEEQSATHNAAGFQLLRNTNQEVPLDPWFDFIIGINGRTIVSLYLKTSMHLL